jgi:hypothetical protein
MATTGIGINKKASSARLSADLNRVLDVLVTLYASRAAAHHLPSTSFISVVIASSTVVRRARDSQHPNQGIEIDGFGQLGCAR